MHEPSGKVRSQIQKQNQNRNQNTKNESEQRADDPENYDGPTFARCAGRTWGTLAQVQNQIQFRCWSGSAAAARFLPLTFPRLRVNALVLMSAAYVLALAFLIGVISGLRTFTAPATVAWGLHLRWLTVGSSWLAFMGSTAAVIIFSVLAFAELVADKLPSTPSRTSARGLSGRFVFGAFAGAILATAGGESWIIGAVLGGVGGIAGAFAGHWVRTRAVKALKCPDFVIAILEDAVAICGGLFIASRF